MFTVMLLLFRCCNGCLLLFRCCNWCVVWLYCYLGVATDVYCEFYVASMGSINTDNMVSFVKVFAYWKLPTSLIWAKSWPCYFLKSLSWKLISHCNTKIISGKVTNVQDVHIVQQQSSPLQEIFWWHLSITVSSFLLLLLQLQYCFSSSQSLNIK